MVAPRDMRALLRGQRDSALGASKNFMIAANREIQRLMLIVANPLWTNHIMRAKHKLSPNDNKAWVFNDCTA